MKDTAIQNTKLSLRETKILAAQKEQFDLVIVGGNFLGANMALEASLSGLKVALFAHEDFGSFDLPIELVPVEQQKTTQNKISATDQLIQRAGHLLTPSKLIQPNLQTPLYNQSKVKARLSSFLNKGNKIKLNTDQFKEYIPQISRSYYHSASEQSVYKVNQARLIIETVKAAKANGATVFNYMQPETFKTGNTTSIETTILTDSLSKHEYQFKSKYILYLAETPVPRLSELGNLTFRSKCTYQGYISKSKLPLNYPVQFELPNKVSGFAIPQQDAVVLYFKYNEFSDYDSSFMEPSLIKAFNNHFPKLKIVPSDIFKTNFSYCPAIDYEEKDQFKTNNNIVLANCTGVLSALNITAKLLAFFEKQLNIPSHCETIRLANTNFDFTTIHKVADFADEKYDEAKSTGVNMKTFSPLAYRYGENVDWITNLAYERHHLDQTWQQKWLECEVDYAIQEEEVLTLQDFFCRRTNEELFQPTEVTIKIDLVADHLANYFNWSNQEKKAQLLQLNPKKTTAPNLH